MLSPMFMRRRARARYEAEMQAAFAADAWHAAGNDGDRNSSGLIVDDEDDGPMWVLPPKAEEPTETVTDVVTADDTMSSDVEPPRHDLTEREVLIDMAAQLTRALERVTTMCDHVIQYVEVDRAERHAMLETER